jgi:hypothetical protein
MKPMPILLLLALAIWGGMPAAALAQRSEAGDRGLRLENDALRTDIRRERLLRSAAKPSQATKLKRKPKRSDKQD